MSIHYSGALSPRPGLVACQAVSPQATATTWHAVDCGDCREQLIDLRLRWLGESHTTGVVRDVEPQPDGGARVTIRWRHGPSGQSGRDNPRMSEFENSWEAC